MSALVRALREEGHPIDFVGGASMGAVIAACVAQGWSDDEINWRIRKAFVDSNPLGDYALPVVALVKGKRVDRRLEEHFGETRICDMHLPFFAGVHKSDRWVCANPRPRRFAHSASSVNCASRNSATCCSRW